MSIFDDLSSCNLHFNTAQTSFRSMNKESISKETTSGGSEKGSGRGRTPLKNDKPCFGKVASTGLESLERNLN